MTAFVLAGQSNTEGHGVIAADPKRNGGKGSLEYAATREAGSHTPEEDVRWTD